MPSYELPTNDVFEQMINANLNNTKPLEMKEVKTMNGKMLFPFWTPVANGVSETTVDYTDYLDVQNKKKRELNLSDKTDIVKPISEFITKNNKVEEITANYEDSTIIGNMQKLLDRINSTVLSDKTGIVKPKAEFKTKTVDSDNQVKSRTVELGIGTMSVKPQKNTMVDYTTEVKTVSYASNGKDSVGSVKPKSDITKQSIPALNKTNTPISTNKNIVLNNKIGIVKPKSEFNTSQAPKVITTKPATVTGATPAIKPGTTVLNDKTGVVKPKNSIHIPVKTTTSTNATTSTEMKLKTASTMKTVLNDKTGIVKPKSAF